MEKYNPERDITPEFISRVANWIGASGEVLVVLRYLAAAGAKDFVLCRSTSDFEQIVAIAPIGTDIEVFRDPQLPMRGRVTDEFIGCALRSILEGQEYLVICLTKTPGSRFGTNRMGDTHADLREALEELRNEEVAMGPCPAFCEPDNEGLISASKGGIDGPR